MTRTPTQLVMEHVTRDPTLLHDARRRLTLAERPVTLQDRIAHPLRHRQLRAYPAIGNERVIRTHVQLGGLRRALVQWAAQHAPSDIGGFRALLAWALLQVDWPTVVRCVNMAEGSANRRARTPRRIRFRSRTAAPTT